MWQHLRESFEALARFEYGFTETETRHELYFGGRFYRWAPFSRSREGIELFLFICIGIPCIDNYSIWTTDQKPLSNDTFHLKLLQLRTRVKLNIAPSIICHFREILSLGAWANASVFSWKKYPIYVSELTTISTADQKIKSFSPSMHAIT